uniref:Uncharacterized protein n=1 Tax=Acrobeloides nanus TaxID=290746 RepID=A0A914E4K1_9BILA
MSIKTNVKIEYIDIDYEPSCSYTNALLSDEFKKCKKETDCGEEVVDGDKLIAQEKFNSYKNQNMLDEERKLKKKIRALWKKSEHESEKLIKIRRKMNEQYKSKGVLEAEKLKEKNFNMGQQKEQSRIMRKSKQTEEDQSSTNIRMFTKKQKQITDETKRKCLNSTCKPPFKPEILEEFPFLTFNQKSRVVFCKYCLVFPQTSTDEVQLAAIPIAINNGPISDDDFNSIQDLKIKEYKDILKHQKSEYHALAERRAISFLESMENQTDSNVNMNEVNSQPNASKPNISANQLVSLQIIQNGHLVKTLHIPPAMFSNEPIRIELLNMPNIDPESATIQIVNHQVDTAKNDLIPTYENIITEDPEALIVTEDAGIAPGFSMLDRNSQFSTGMETMIQVSTVEAMSLNNSNVLATMTPWDPMSAEMMTIISSNVLSPEISNIPSNITTMELVSAENFTLLDSSFTVLQDSMPVISTQTETPVLAESINQIPTIVQTAPIQFIVPEDYMLVTLPEDQVSYVPMYENVIDVSSLDVNSNMTGIKPNKTEIKRKPKKSKIPVITISD